VPVAYRLPVVKEVEEARPRLVLPVTVVVPVTDRVPPTVSLPYTVEVEMYEEEAYILIPKIFRNLSAEEPRDLTPSVVGSMSANRLRVLKNVD
jgi:hypothetical protein